MLQESLSSHLNILIGPRLSLGRLLLIVSVFGLEAINETNNPLVDFFEWQVNEALSFFSDAFLQLPVGKVAIVIFLVIFVIPILATSLLRLCTKIFLPIAKPMLLNLVQKRTKTQLRSDSLKKLLELKAYGKKRIHQLADIFEIYIFIVVWMWIPNTYLDVGLELSVLYTCITLLLLLLLGYVVNYLVVTKVIPVDLFTSKKS